MQGKASTDVIERHRSAERTLKRVSLLETPTRESTAFCFPAQPSLTSSWDTLPVAEHVRDAPGASPSLG